MTGTRIKVWDGSLRVFHWLLAISVAGAFITGWLGGGLMQWHGRLGLFILGLLSFRLVWGFIGSTYARWSVIFKAPLSIPAYVRGAWHQLGHNPLGSLSVVALLGLLAVQVSTGLMANDDIAFQGPLYALVDRDFSSELTSLHRQIQWLLLALILLHLAAIGFYQHVKKQALVLAMLQGQQPQTHPEQRAAQGGSWQASLVAVVFAGCVVFGAQSAAQWWAPQPAPSSVQTPDW